MNGWVGCSGTTTATLPESPDRQDRPASVFEQAFRDARSELEVRPRAAEQVSGDRRGVRGTENAAVESQPRSVDMAGPSNGTPRALALSLRHPRRSVQSP